MTKAKPTPIRMENAALPCLAGAGAAALLMLAAVASIAAVESTARHAIDDEVRQNLARLAATLAATIDAEAHTKLTDPLQEGGTLYNTLNRPLTAAIARTDGVRFVYTLRPDQDQLVFVLDGTPRGDADNDGVEDHSFLMEVYEDPDPAAWDAIRTGTITVTTEPYTDAWGTFLSGFAPVTTADGSIDGVVGVDASIAEYQDRLAQVDRAAAWALLPASFISLAGGIGVWWGSRRWVRATAEINASRLDAVRANRAKSELLANISHELRTPLNAIMGFVAIAGDERCGPMERADANATIRHNAEHLLTLINDLLDMSKAEAGAITIDPTEIDLPELIDRSVAPLRLRAMEKRIALRVEGVGDLPERVVLDRTRVRQILLNLLSNAVKFTDTGSVHLRVAVRDDTLFLRVTDTGPGMTRDEIDRLFTPFSQVGMPDKRRHGTGLGLAISRHLVGLMGGTIRVESAPGAGSTFTAEIPCAPAAAQALPGPDGPAHWERLHGARIAIAEDGEDNRRLLRLILRRAGAEIAEFRDGEQARRGLLNNDEPFDLLITDWDMPVLSGAGLVRKLRESGWTGPVLSLTAHAMPEQERQCLAAGCDAHLTKPLDAEALIHACADLLRQHRRAA